MNNQRSTEVHTLEMETVGAQLGLTPGFFLTREQGERAYPLLQQRLVDIPDGQAMMLVFPMNQLMDVSFADESVVRLGEELLTGEFSTRGVLLQGLTDDSIKNFNAVIKLRQLKLAFIHLSTSGSWQCIGHLEPVLQDTLGIVAQHGRISASELADLGALAINTASTRLKRLYDQHLITRTHEISRTGIEYIYRMWAW